MSNIIAIYGDTTSLDALLPPGTDRFFSLLTKLPDSLGSGAIEASYTSYARIAASIWSDQNAIRKNVGEILFQESDDNVTIKGLGIYDAVSAGSLLAAFSVLPNIRLKNNYTPVIQDRALEIFLGAETSTPGSYEILINDNAVTYYATEPFDAIQELFPTGPIWQRGSLS